MHERPFHSHSIIASRLGTNCLPRACRKEHRKSQSPEQPHVRRYIGSGTLLEPFVCVRVWFSLVIRMKRFRRHRYPCRQSIFGTRSSWWEDLRGEVIKVMCATWRVLFEGSPSVSFSKKRMRKRKRLHDIGEIWRPSKNLGASLRSVVPFLPAALPSRSSSHTFEC